MKKYLLAVLCPVLICFGSVQAQQVTSSGGGSFQSAEATMTFTVGETVIATFSNPNGTMTQGFNQAQLAPEIQLQGAEGNLACGGVLFFPTVEPESNSSTMLTLRNVGNDPLRVSTLNLSGDPVFSMVNPPSLPLILQADQAQVLNLSFNPVQADNYTGTLTIEHTDTDESPCIVSLQASSVIAKIPALPLPGVFLLGLILLVLGMRSVHSL